MNPHHKPLHVLELEGTSRARGYQHGRALREPIERAVDFYRFFFGKHLGLEWTAVRERVGPFLEATVALSRSSQRSTRASPTAPDNGSRASAPPPPRTGTPNSRSPRAAAPTA